jgi:hypothetical protein
MHLRPQPIALQMITPNSGSYCLFSNSNPRIPESDRCGCELLIHSRLNNFLHSPVCSDVSH